MLAFVPAAVCAIAMVFLREGRVAGGADDEAHARGFAAISTLAVAIALYLLAAELTGQLPTASASAPTGERRLVPSLAIFLAWQAPAGLLPGRTYKAWRWGRCPHDGVEQRWEPGAPLFFLF
ncbi:hypothetical protein ACQ4PT_004440 [Festuca glaucescens]